MTEPVQPVAHPTRMPGWYDDPWRTSQVRWWDGNSWTPAVANFVPLPTPPPTAQPWYPGRPVKPAPAGRTLLGIVAVLEGLLLLQIGLLFLSGPQNLWFSTVQWTPRQLETEHRVLQWALLNLLAAPLLAAAGNALRDQRVRRSALWCVIVVQVAVFVITVRAPVWGVHSP
jgi:hypothetical protein